MPVDIPVNNLCSISAVYSLQSPSVYAFSLLLLLCDSENIIVKIYNRCAEGQESKILLNNSKREKIVSLNYKTICVRTAQPSNQARALKNRGSRKPSL